MKHRMTKKELDRLMQFIIANSKVGEDNKLKLKEKEKEKKVND